jgi:Acyltransferase
MPEPTAAAMRRGFVEMARRGLRGVWVRGELPDGPFVWAATHHSWWDPFLASVLLDRHGRPVSLVMAQENLARYGFLRHLGVFGTAEPRRGLAYLTAGRVLVVFPEGELRGGARLGPLQDGAAWYAGQAGVPLCAVAVRLLMRGHQAAEAYVAHTVVPSAQGRRADVTARLADALAGQLDDIDALNAKSDPREPLPGFRPVLRGRRSWDERIDAMSRWRPWAR